MICSFRNLVEKAAATAAFVTGKRKAVGDVVKEHRLDFSLEHGAEAWSKLLIHHKGHAVSQRKPSNLRFSLQVDFRDGSWRSPAILPVLSVFAPDPRDVVRSSHPQETQ